MAVSYRRDQYGNNAKFVARITLVKGVPFYGYNVGYRPFLKVYMYNPVVMTRLADLLHQGVIMKRKFQPYEAHLQYLLQFMVDYNLYGCDYLDTSKASFRSPVPVYDQEGNTPHLWHDQSIPVDSITDDALLPRVSHCSIEVDICVQHITNRKMVQERSLHHDFVERNAPLPADLKLVYSMEGLWRDETKRRRRQMPRNKAGESPFPPEALVTMSADPRESQPQGWIHEDEYRSQMQGLINAELTELTELGNESPDFATFARQNSLEDDDVHTALEAVEDLYPTKLMPVLGLPPHPTQSSIDPYSSIEVDEKKILQDVAQADDLFPEDSDEEALQHMMDDVNDVQPANQEAQGATPVDATVEAGAITAPGRNLPLGLCHSVFKTGILSRDPVPQALLDAAEDEGLVGRIANPQPAPDSDSSKRRMKRVGSGTSSKQDSQKRARIPTSQTSSASVQSDLVKPVRGRSQPSSTAKQSGSSSQRASKLQSGDSSRQTANQMLNYPIVKDHTDPGNKLRLSQRSQLASSQQSDGGAKVRKRTSFEQQSLLYNSEETAGSMMSSKGAPSASLRLEKNRDKGERLLATLRNTTSQPFILFAALPPTAYGCIAMASQGLPDVLYQDAFYSREKDVPERSREYAGREYRLESNTVPYLPKFDTDGLSPAAAGVSQEALLGKQGLEQEQAQQRRDCSYRSWEYAPLPPPREEVEDWQLKGEKRDRPRLSNKQPNQPLPPSRRRWMSQIDGPTPANKHGFRYTQKGKSTSVEHEVQYMSIMSLEVHVNTRGKFVPNPEEDEVQCIFWACKSDETVRNSQSSRDQVQQGIIVLSESDEYARKLQKSTNGQVIRESCELDLIVRMVEIVQTYDPDILTGYEVHGSSWGYLIERGRVKYDYNLCDEFSRMKSDSHGRFGRQSDRWGFHTTSTIRVTGRHMINIWRAMQGELNLLQYTLENVAWHLLHRRVPHYSWKTLTSWYLSGKNADLVRLVRYYKSRTLVDLEILDSNELVARTSEQARLLGVDFFSVFSRGSQFKVESIMFRIAKPENFIFVSPSRKQVGNQNALECLPLVMEPQSSFYTSPVLVLDFQSLYPSVMIAYNYCYSTFLGRIANWRGTSKMGFTEYKRQQGLLALLKDHINIAPNGVMYAKQGIRKSLLAKMLTEILETRVMVKSGMKKDKDDKVLQQLLNNRQLALKLLANVTYGYTSASFSGRMPCSEIADSIVQTGRETLERATAYIHSVERWGAEVVYGDTDSLFIHLKGKTRDQAFDIGNEISQAITDMNPRPVKLKFEKVYHPCVLLAKKRYVGYKYESRDQAKPDFDAKGIETVRRDGTPAEQMIEEKALKLLFETADLSQIKEYFQKQCDKIMRGAVSVQDFCFAREVRLGTYSDKGPPPAGALISTRKMLEDARAEPQYGERVPYVVISGAPGARLIDRCVAPEDLIANPHWQLDAEYYISKNLIPPLERIFNLVGANVRQWYDEMPKVQRIHQQIVQGQGSKRATLESYMRSTHCLVCSAKFSQDTAGQPNPNGNGTGQDPVSVLCSVCRADVPSSLLALQTRLASEERRFLDVLSACRTCAGLSPLDDVRCDSKDCPVFWTRTKQRAKVIGARASAGPVIRALAESTTVDLDW